MGVIDLFEIIEVQRQQATFARALLQDAQPTFGFAHEVLVMEDGSASRICGNDNQTSTTVPMTVSTFPPTKPLTSPAVTPMMRLTM
ncbi:MAG: hypothetical protein ABWZ85_05515, partial [Luteibacter sp.]